MEVAKIKINELLGKKQKLTFLVGAGCSVDVPSCLPAGRPMMEEIIKFTCIESEINNILSIKGLRFEGLVEIVRDNLDTKLSVIDYYGECDKPNLQHFYLAEMINDGNFVMTTNFDFLIEHAMMQSKIPQKEIKIIISRSNFERYSDPQTLFKKGIKCLFKIHGSTKNVIDGNDERESLIATIQAFGSNKEGLNVFQVEPFKRPLFENIANDRSLVIMGYSGSDDFDVVPTLKVLKNLNNVIWINYVKDDGGKEKIYEIYSNTEKSDKVNEILVDIKNTNNAKHVFRIDANTTRMVQNLIKKKPKISDTNFDLSVKKFLQDNIGTPHYGTKYAIPCKIYLSFAKFPDGLVCAKKWLKLAQEKGDKDWEKWAYEHVASFYHYQAIYPQALEFYEKAISIEAGREDKSHKASLLTNIGSIHLFQSNFHDALKYFQEALEIFEELQNLKWKAIVFNNIGNAYLHLKDHEKARKYIEDAIKLNDELGELKEKASCLGNLGDLLNSQQKYTEAIEKFAEALQISRQLSDLYNINRGLKMIGRVYSAQGKHEEAVRYSEESLKAARELGSKFELAATLKDVGNVYYKKGVYESSLKSFKEALEIDEQLNIGSSQAMDNWWIGTIYGVLKRKEEALKHLEQAQKMFRDAGDEDRAKTVQDRINNLKG